jgi:hypothetical protein
MHMKLKFFITSFIVILTSTVVLGQTEWGKTYCNPVDIDYTYMIYNAHEDQSYRSGADPAVVEFRNEYYMFVTRSMGYWHSEDLLHWDFVKPEDWYFQGSNAPAAFNYKDSVLYMTGHPSGSMSVLYSDDPASGKWEATPAILHRLQDPALFIDDDGQAYMYWGSSNKHPIRGKKLDKDLRFRPSDSIAELFNLNIQKHGWERFGEDHSDSMRGWIEGPWMTKHNGTYYLQYAAPGTQFNIYADGVYTSDDPLGPYEYAPNNPVSYKPGGFANGAGHGSTVKGPHDNYWHFGTSSISVNVRWERRIVMYRNRFDDGLMHTNTYFGDYPHYAPMVHGKAGEFTGWMLLSYDKPIEASSSLQDHGPGNVVDENIRSFWVAQENNKSQWLKMDLEEPAEVYATQVNYHDYKSDKYGRVPGLYHRYVIEGSKDGENWTTLVDKSDSYEDTPNDYTELAEPQTVRYIRFKNIHCPNRNLAISGLRIFGHGQGNPPDQVENLKVERLKDRREANIKWETSEDAQGYNVLWGIAPDKLYNSWMVYDRSQLNLRALSVGQSYYFKVEAFNENGISERTPAIKVE